MHLQTGMLSLLLSLSYFLFSRFFLSVKDRSFEVPDQYRCGGPLQFSSDQNLGVHVLNRHWYKN